MTVPLLVPFLRLRERRNHPRRNSSTGANCVCEAMAARALVGAWDNSTRGLDSSTALEYVQALRIATDVARMTTIVSLYQAGESLYTHFDKVCVIYAGKMAYFGPATQARQYFIDMGYVPANRQTTPDFLVAVTDPMARVPRSVTGDDMYGPWTKGKMGTPRSAEEFAAYFLTSSAGVANRAELERFKAERVNNAELSKHYLESTWEEKATTSRNASAYTISVPMQARAVMLRQLQIMRGSYMAQSMNIVSFVFQGIILGTVYLKTKTDTDSYYSRGGMLYFALLFYALIAQAEMPILFSMRKVIHRHQAWALYHPFVDAIASTLVDLPISFLNSVVYVVILYFCVGLQRSVGQFFVYFAMMFLSFIVMRAYYRAMSAAFVSQVNAIIMAGLSLMTFTLYTGYAVAKPLMIGALRWLSYLNPLRYSFETIITNEFRSIDGECTTLIPQGPGYEGVTLANQVCGTPGAMPGESTVNGNTYVNLSFDYHWDNTALNFGIMIIFFMGFFLALLVFTEFNTKEEHSTSTTLFKRGSAAAKQSEKNNDDEEQIVAGDSAPGQLTPTARGKEGLAMKDIFSWQNLNYDITMPNKEERRLLSDIHGYVAPGKLTALMGESGAGKTTLLNVLAKRTTMGVVTGDCFVNGRELPQDFQCQTGYCQQMDTHLGTATVREALLFSAKLRQPQSVPLAEKEAYVEECLQMCGLSAYADAIVGTLGVEHRKRTTIGVELAAKPKLLLFLDEPTSGLDSQSAWAIVSFLRSLADAGQAILCTIHQPSAELFQQFDRLLLLQKGGKTVYFGDIGHQSTKMINYFERNNSRSCGPEENPAEFMLDVIGAGATAKSAQDWSELWQRSAEAEVSRTEIVEIVEHARSRGAVSAAIKSQFATSWLYQLKELVVRDWVNHWRDPTYVMAKMSLNIVSGLFIGFTFFNSKDSISGSQNKLFSVYISTMMIVPLANQIMLNFLVTRNVYEIRERPSRMYSWTALLTSQIIVALPWNVIGSIIYFFIWYWTTGLDTDRAPYTLLMYIVIFPFYYTTVTMAVAAMSPSMEVAAITFSFLFAFIFTTNGVLQPFSKLGWWQWMYWASPFTYLVETIVAQAIGKQDINCSAFEFVPIVPPSGSTCGEYLGPFMSFAGGYVQDMSATDICRFCVYRTTDEYMDKFLHMYHKNIWRDFGFVCAFIGFNTFCIFAFTYLFRIKKSG